MVDSILKQQNRHAFQEQQKLLYQPFWLQQCTSIEKRYENSSNL